MDQYSDSRVAHTRPPSTFQSTGAGSTLSPRDAALPYTHTDDSHYGLSIQTFETSGHDAVPSSAFAQTLKEQDDLFYATFPDACPPDYHFTTSTDPTSEPPIPAHTIPYTDSTASIYYGAPRRTLALVMPTGDALVPSVTPYYPETAPTIPSQPSLPDLSTSIPHPHYVAPRATGSSHSAAHDVDAEPCSTVLDPHYASSSTGNNLDAQGYPTVLEPSGKLPSDFLSHFGGADESATAGRAPGVVDSKLFVNTDFRRMDNPTSTYSSPPDSHHPISPTGLVQTQSTSPASSNRHFTSPLARNASLASTSSSKSTSRRAGNKALACLFCRARKIACGPPVDETADPTCNQCAKRSLKCEFPVENRRAVRGNQRTSKSSHTHTRSSHGGSPML
ncbi:hypothetical protein CYLTODRAFT_410386 [Cylindrobasidium torrendii FP15055 ss-10]|uniref:Zn(2)-C6 fungal-type domain-containing protein n=1 Tax=Cylindrobasidium torrendii FP15055 ss-10 TaxID=1314674 RepID=A0A0D7BD78_9AGAR|nr:hypothetical protein CYLTODRAFT_410386 [Cylindrobasidium torrendii FP15055 ss-10]